MKNWVPTKVMAICICVLMTFLLNHQTWAADQPIKIGLITSRSGVFSEWGTQEIRGFQLGLDYATKGTNKILGRPIQLIIEDDASTPEAGVQKAVKLLSEDKVDILSGGVSSGVALAVMEKAKEAKKVYIVSCASANQITGANFNRYTFRTGRSLRQNTLAGSAYIASHIGKKIAYFGPDYAGGRDFIASWKQDLTAKGTETVLELYAPLTTTDFTPYLQKIRASDANTLVLVVTGANFEGKLPTQIVELGVNKKMKIALDMSDTYLKAVGQAGIGQIGTILYYHTLFNNPINKWLVDEHQKRFGTPPYLWAGQSFASGIAIAAAVQKANSVDTEPLIKALEGLEFYGPKSSKEKMRIRPEDHQTMQGIPVVEVVKTGKNYVEPKLLMLVPAADCTPPITVSKN